MSDPNAFFAQFAPMAAEASAATGVAASVILAQWGWETSYGQSNVFVSQHNFAGIGGSGDAGASGGYATYSSLAKGLAGYINTLNSGYYAAVRSAQGVTAQAIALGNSPWAGSHYDNGTGPGSDLLDLITANHLAHYDGAVYNVTPTAPSSLNTTPTAGLASSITTDSIILNGHAIAADVSAAVVDLAIDLTITGASTVTLTLSDPFRALLRAPLFSQTITLGIPVPNGPVLWFELVAVSKSADMLTVTFEAWAVAQLRKATGVFTISPGQMTRSQFAHGLVIGSGAPGTPPWNAPAGLGFVAPPNAEDWTTQEALSRGTIGLPLEDSWTCLQRLANEVGWRCFESQGYVFFGPDSWLVSRPATMSIAEWTNGVDNIDGEYDVGQSMTNLSVGAVADNWISQPGDHVIVANCGVFDGDWLVSEITKSIWLPEATITLTQAQPSLPEPSSGGSQPAAGAGFSQAGNQQSTSGTSTAAQAVAYANRQLGVAYQWGGDNPATGFDCSGLVQAAYASAGISLPRTSEAQFAAGPAVPAGAGNLRPGDLVFFGSRVDASHVGMYIGNGQMIDAPHTGSVVRVDSFDPTIGARWGSDIYLGAARPAQ